MCFTMILIKVIGEGTFGNFTDCSLCSKAIFFEEDLTTFEFNRFKPFYF